MKKDANAAEIFDQMVTLDALPDWMTDAAKRTEKNLGAFELSQEELENFSGLDLIEHPTR